MYRNYGELPSDKDVQDVTQGAPPAWYRPSGNMFSPGFPGGYSTGYGSYGEREDEPEVNPLETIQDLKFKQEMPKSIPPVAARYTDIEPISPLFRPNGAKYGFGGLGQAGTITAVGNLIHGIVSSPVLLILLISSLAGVYFLFIKK